jgi:calcineurin-like phosphoesterase family protein
MENELVVLTGGMPVLTRPPDWVISDTHFAHANIVTYCPWRSVWANCIDEHDHRLIAEWNRVVLPTDVVLHLGDFALCQVERLTAIRLSLNGRVILVRGNHDHSAGAMRRCHMDWVGSHLTIRVGDASWFCRHDPLKFTLDEAKRYRGLLHGHCHGNGYRKEVPAGVVAKATDCSLDALRSIAPVPWSVVVR